MTRCTTGDDKNILANVNSKKLKAKLSLPCETKKKINDNKTKKEQNVTTCTVSPC